MNDPRMDEYRFPEKAPVCDACGEEIQGEFYYDVCGDRVCESCIGEYLEDMKVRIE